VSLSDGTTLRYERLLEQFTAMGGATLHSRAEVLLREGTYNVAEISDRLGYEDAANFARACRRWFGATPSALRRGRNERQKSVI
jgi:AraC-like DNA-binding protein